MAEAARPKQFRHGGLLATMEEKYTLELHLVKILENPDGSRNRQCHRVIVETNGLDQANFVDMQKDVAAMLETWAAKDEPQGITPPETKAA